ncbi:MAG: hypothetical protein HS126_03355 [Anaerolineales bacterium]|nr:hypothetical protein [Anaerolineales bacterium]
MPAGWPTNAPHGPGSALGRGCSTAPAGSQALREERDAQVLVVTAKAGEQILIRDTGHGQWRQAHLDMRLYANGAATDPSPLEIAVWREFNRPASSCQSSPPHWPAVV